MPGLNVQYGSGWSVAEGWLNFDASPTLRLERLPLIGGLVRINAQRFPQGVIYGDIVRGLPVADDSAKAVYASHVLEHLSRNDFELALANTRRIIAPGGIFRLVVPDLETRVRRYFERRDVGDPQAADLFMESCCLGRRERARSLAGHVRAALGNSEHLWMYDRPAMRAALESAGFDAIRECAFGDCEDPDFRMVEERSRFFYSEEHGWAEVAFEARKLA